MQDYKDVQTDSAGSESLHSLMQINSLTYSVPPSLSLVTHRNYHKLYSQRSQYSGTETIEFVFSTGSSYLEAKRSFLCFDIQVATTAGVTFGGVRSNALSIIKSLTLTHSSGTTIEYLPGLNLYKRITSDWTQSFNKRDSINQVFGEVAVESKLPDLKTKLSCCIPLSELSDFFNQTQCVPSMLVLG